MKERKVHLQFETTYIDVSHLVKYDTLTITPRAFNDSYRYAQNECSFEVIYEDTVYPLYRYATNDILVKVEEVDNGITTPLFLGHATYTKKRTYNGILDNTFFSIDATDDLDYMDIPVGDIFVKGYAVLDPANPSKSIVHYLANIAGWGESKISTLVTIPTAIQCFAPPNPEDTVLDTLSDLLYEYGYVLNLDASGNIVPIKWNYIAGVTTPNEFNDSNIMNEMRVSDSRDSYDSVQCTYYDIGTAHKVKLYHDSNCGYNADGSFAGYGVYPNKYYPPEANVIDDTTGILQVVEQEYTDDSIRYFTNKAIKENLDYNYKAFSSDFSAMIATEGHFADSRTDAGITVDSIYGNKKCRILYHNPTGGMLNIWYNNVFGTVYYKSTERTVSVDLVSPFIKQYNYKSKFIYSQSIADSFAKGIASQYKMGKTKYEFDSETEYQAGELVTVKTDDGTNQICLITERSWTEYSKTYSYKLLACGTDTGTLQPTKRTSSVKVNVQTANPFSLELSTGQITIPYEGTVSDFTNAFVIATVKSDGRDYTQDWTLTATPTDCVGSFTENKYAITSTTNYSSSVIITATHNDWGTLTNTFMVNNTTGIKGEKGEQGAAGSGIFVVITDILETDATYETGQVGQFAGYIYTWVATTPTTGQWTMSKKSPVSSEGLTRYFSFDEYVNTPMGNKICLDNSGNNNNGVAKNTTLVSGFRGNAFLLNSRSSYINL